MKKIFVIFFLPLLTIILLSCSKQDLKFKNIKNLYTAKGECIVCFGNSLTKGLGAREGKDYPSLIQKKVDLLVINAGVNGDTTFSALARLQSDVLEKNPKIVIVELGANDFLMWGSPGLGPSSEETFKNLKYILDKITENGAVAVLAAIPFNLEYEKNYKKVAKECGALLIPNIMKGIIGNPSLMSLDRIHPNEKGYEVMAENVLEYLEPLLNKMK